MTNGDSCRALMELILESNPVDNRDEVNKLKQHLKKICPNTKKLFVACFLILGDRIQDCKKYMEESDDSPMKEMLSKLIN